MIGWGHVVLWRWKGDIHSAPCILGRLLLRCGLLGSPFGLWSRSLGRRRPGACSCCFGFGIGLVVAGFVLGWSSHSRSGTGIVAVGVSGVVGRWKRVVVLDGAGEVMLLEEGCHGRVA